MFSGVEIFGLICIGLLTGYLGDSLFNRSIYSSLLRDILAGITGSLLIGYVAAALNLGAEMVYAIIGALAILFILHAFHVTEASAENPSQPQQM